MTLKESFAEPSTPLSSPALKQSTGSVFKPVIAFICCLAISGVMSSCTILIDEHKLFSPHRTKPCLLTGVQNVTKEDFRIPTSEPFVNTGYILFYTGSKDFMLYFPGVGESAYDDLKRALVLCESSRLNVVVTDYRGYGSSAGAPKLEHLLTDADTVCRHVRAKYKPVSLFAYGHSIGSAAAEYLGGKAAYQVNGVILEAAFTNGKDAVASIGRNLPGPLKKLIKLLPAEELATWRPQPEELVTRLKCPLLVMHGGRDNHFPVSMSENLFNNAGTPVAQKHILIVTNAGHFIPLSTPPASSAIADFVRNNKTP